MDIIPSKKTAYFGLLLASCLTFVVWRVELEYHGWAGLTWIGYFHWAIPAGLLLFVSWFAIFVQAESWKQKLLYVGLVLLLGGGAIWGMLLVLYNIFGGMRATLWRDGMAGTVEWWFLTFLSIVILPLLPSILLWIARAFRVRIPIEYCLLAQGLYWGAPFISVELIRILEWKVTADLIHIFKTGYIYPLWFFTVGFPLIHGRKVLPRAVVEAEILDAP